MHIDNVIFLILSKNAYTKFSAGPLRMMDWCAFSVFYSVNFSLGFPSFSHQLRTFLPNGIDGFSRTFLIWFRTFLTRFRTFLIWNRTFLIWIFSQSSYLYYVQKNFEGLGKTENKDYKIYYKIIIKYQILFF